MTRDAWFDLATGGAVLLAAAADRPHRRAVIAGLDPQRDDCGAIVWSL